MLHLAPSPWPVKGTTAELFSAPPRPSPPPPLLSSPLILSLRESVCYHPSATCLHHVSVNMLVRAIDEIASTVRPKMLAPVKGERSSWSARISGETCLRSPGSRFAPILQLFLEIFENSEMIEHVRFLHTYTVFISDISFFPVFPT